MELNRIVVTWVGGAKPDCGSWGEALLRGGAIVAKGRSYGS